MPWHSGPYASAFANLCVSLYPMFPAFKSGNISTLVFRLGKSDLPGATI